MSTDDSVTRFDLLELDTPTAPDHRGARARQAIPTVTPTPAPGSVPPGVPAIVAPTAPALTTGTVERPGLQPVTESSPAVVQAVAAAVTQARAEIPAGRAAQIRQPIAVRNTAPGQPATPEGDLRAGNLIGGAAAQGNGALFGWTGSGPITRGGITLALGLAGMPSEWAPASKSAHAYAGQAVKILDSTGYVSRAGRGRVARGGDAIANTIAARREYKARWLVGAVSGVAGAVGGSFGRTVLTVTLPTAGDALGFEGDPGLAARVREAYDNARNGETYEAGEVTAWLRGILVSRFRAVRLGGVWYVPHRYVADCERLCTALARSWGADWILPALPIATSQQMLTGIRNGIADEVAAIEVALTEARAEQAKRGAVEITGRKAASLLVDVGNVAERLTHYAVLLGPTHTAPVGKRIDALRSTLGPLADGLSQRAELIAEEMGWREGLS